MRKISEEAVQNCMDAIPFKKSNTQVIVHDNVTVLSLFGNEIAFFFNDPERTIEIRNCGWKSATTKERLNAIRGVNISQKKGIWYLNGREWDGNLINIESNK
jgi:hypothetical protein